MSKQSPPDAVPPPLETPLDSAQVSMLTTEHFTLQTAKAATISEANGRASLYLSAVSSGLVALSLLHTSTKGGVAFEVTAFVLGPTLVLLGLFVYVRVLQNALEDALYSLAINRVRHAYLEHTPALRRYFTLSDHDDVQGFSQNMVTLPGHSSYQLLITTASAIGILNSVLLGALAGGVLGALGMPLAPLLALAALVGLLSAWGCVHYQQLAWKNLERIPTRFPSGHQPEPPVEP